MNILKQLDAVNQEIAASQEKTIELLDTVSRNNEQIIANNAALIASNEEIIKRTQALIEREKKFISELDAFLATQ